MARRQIDWIAEITISNVCRDKKILMFCNVGVTLVVLNIGQSADYATKCDIIFLCWISRAFKFRVNTKIIRILDFPFPMHNAHAHWNLFILPLNFHAIFDWMIAISDGNRIDCIILRLTELWQKFYRFLAKCV